MNSRKVNKEIGCRPKWCTQSPKMLLWSKDDRPTAGARHNKPLWKSENFWFRTKSDEKGSGRTCLISPEKSKKIKKSTILRFLLKLYASFRASCSHLRCISLRCEERKRRKRVGNDF